MGLVGMKNMGNTCYMNACIQCLSHTFELSSVFMKITGQDINRSSQSKGLIATEFANLIRTVWAERPRSVFEPARLKKQIGKLNETFAGFAQQDSQELLRFLLDGAPQPQPVLCRPLGALVFVRPRRAQCMVAVRRFARGPQSHPAKAAVVRAGGY